MTLHTRNRLLLGFVFADSLVVLLSLAALVIAFVSRPQVEIFLKSMLFSEQKPDSFYYVLLNVSAGLLPAAAATAGAFILNVSFKKTSATEVFFLMFFLFSFGLEGIRMLFPVSFFFKADYNTYMLLTRLVLFARVCATGFLFATSLFTGGFSSQRLGFILGLSGIVALLVATQIPVHAGALGRDLVFPIGYSSLTIFGLILIQIMGLANIAIAGVVKKEKRYIVLGGAYTVLCLAQLGLYLCRSIPFNLTALFLLALGVFVYAKSIHDAYLWS